MLPTESKAKRMSIKLYKKGKISDRAYRICIDTGKVSDSVIRLLAFKVMKNKKLDEKETTIFFDKTSKVNEMIVVISKKHF